MLAAMSEVIINWLKVIEPSRVRGLVHRSANHLTWRPEDIFKNFGAQVEPLSG